MFGITITVRPEKTSVWKVKSIDLRESKKDIYFDQVRDFIYLYIYI